MELFRHPEILPFDFAQGKLLRSLQNDNYIDILFNKHGVR
jgi:hypothetical protein